MHNYSYISTGAGFSVLNDGTETAVINQDGTLNGSTVIDDGSITLAKLATGITPSHIAVFADQATTAGGAAAEAITVTGAAATDLAFVQLVDEGSNTVTVANAVVTENTLTVTFSADPGADAIINYEIIRAAA